MKALIFSKKCDAEQKACTARITDELKRRGHEVHTLSIMQAESPALRWPFRQRLPQKKHFKAMLSEYAEKLKTQLESDSYDVIIATHITCARILSVLYLNDEFFLPVMVYVGFAEEVHRGHQKLSCDAYIVTSEGEKNNLLRWGIAPALIHQIDTSHPQTNQICAIIEDEIQQWEDLKQAFQIEL